MKTLQCSARAFTLVEIMIVAAIIGMLAALAIPAFTKARQASREKAITNNLRQFAAAAQQYILENGVTQAAYSDLVGVGTAYYIQSINTVANEDYTTITVLNATTQISVSSAVITVSYNL